MLGLHDIPDPEPLLPGIAVPLWFWILFATVITGGATALFLILRRKTQPAAKPDTSYLDSRNALKDLHSSLADQSLAEVATGASLILRHYLATTLQEPALYETHEEFIMRSDALEKLPAGARDRLAPLLTQLAEAKYGPSTVNFEGATTLINNCLGVLQGLESTRERKVA